jgi:hypothetical protein
MITITSLLETIEATDTKLIARHMSHAIEDDQGRIEHVSTNLLLTTLHKIYVSEAKLNDRHLIGMPLAEKYG